MDSDYLTPLQAGRLLGVSPKTITRWAKQGKLSCTVTLGGHRRFAKSDIQKLIKETKGDE